MIVTGTLAVGGGAEKVAALLGTNLTKRGHEVHLVTFYEQKDKYPFDGIYHTFNEKVHRNRLHKLFRVTGRIWKIQEYIRRNNIDSVVTFLEEANFYTLIAKLAFFLRQSVIVSVRININSRELPFRIGTRVLYPFARHVVSVSKGVERILEREYGLDNVSTIYNPIDSSFAQKRAKEPLSDDCAWIKERSPLLISNGRYTHQKGQWHLIRSFSLVKETYPTATLVILGDGDLKEKLQELIEKCSLGDHVFLIGRHTNVYNFLDTGDIFVFSSLFEGMPNAMMEALALGLPIISAECATGPREILAPDIDVEEEIEYPHRGRNGILTSPFTPDQIWESPETVPLTNEEREFAEMIITQLRQVNHSTPDLSPFETEQIIDEWESLL